MDKFKKILDQHLVAKFEALVEQPNSNDIQKFDHRRKEIENTIDNYKKDPVLEKSISENEKLINHLTTELNNAKAEQTKLQIEHRKKKKKSGRKK